MVIQEEDSEETKEEQPMFQRKRTRQADFEQAQPEPEGINIEANA
ncbi:hypothetical protein A2U01_0115084, partial [Trifolium medium]|nr:hypothetical protein [Trifolium medium]